MTGPRKRSGPGGNRGHAQAVRLGAWRVYQSPTRSGRLPDDWRKRLPEPESYYRAHVAKLGKAHGNGWAQGRCPFHEDGTASLSVNLSQPCGFWKCFAGCGSGDMVTFHMKRSGLPFADAARDLLGVQA
ncbi:CHC2 zinc finger domain-containing protein [Xanthomonas hortorum]|uniref:CHC2 zinc finger domain-containing protein n=1 Tax=Xanthomonas hortorum pv. hederae TaxID=453603 RepID=A0A9X3YYW2_9XANT|nr:CHC2 zinc finger domain-containing protein [Xanthomonas hortorum]MDC8637048.1 CHC2 zinc finger domain-containing protein [Xanthomonas hortorum pv. hederae]